MDKPSAGFTLLELLITVIIVGILSAIAIPALVAQVDKARYAEAKIQMGCMRREILGYQLEYGEFPPDVNDNKPYKEAECFEVNNGPDSKVPFQSRYDYENWGHSGECYIGITFFGKNQSREFPPNNSASRPTEPGFHDIGVDDLVLTIGIVPKLIGGC